MSNQVRRCAWVTDDPLYGAYHDTEWGVPTFDDRVLFEMLILEGAQAGLSWYTILKKREAYRRAFDDFDPWRMARYEDRKIEVLMQDGGIVRHRQKIAAAVDNARAFLAVREEYGGFADYIWRFAGGEPKDMKRRRSEDVPAWTPESEAMSRDLKRRGFRFVGKTICYAYMQAVGMVNDHTLDCFRHREIVAFTQGKGAASRRRD